MDTDASSKEESVKVFFTQLLLNGVDKYIENVQAQLLLLPWGGQFIPITVNDAQYDNSFVCSPYSHYVSYATIVFDKIKIPLLNKLLSSLQKGYGYLMRKGKINQVVIVNNWLFTTNPPLSLDQGVLKELLEYLIRKFPNHAIIFRSVTKEICPAFYNALKTLQFDFIASRYVYLTQAKDESVFQTRIVKSDLRLLKDSKYTQLSNKELSESDINQMVELYQALYIHKYSKLNPQFNAAFVKLAIDSGILNFTALKEDNQVKGCFGFYYRDGIMISPFFGYDPANGDNKGIYRILSTLLLLEARKHQALFNQSAGGAFFKKIRRAQGHFEYTALYDKHLPWKRRVPWQFLKSLMNTLGSYVMKRY